MIHGKVSSSSESLSCPLAGCWLCTRDTCQGPRHRNGRQLQNNARGKVRYRFLLLFN